MGIRKVVHVPDDWEYMNMFIKKFSEADVLFTDKGTVILAPLYNFPLYGRKIPKIKNGDKVLKRKLK